MCPRALPSVELEGKQLLWVARHGHGPRGARAGTSAAAWSPATSGCATSDLSFALWCHWSGSHPGQWFASCKPQGWDTMNPAGPIPNQHPSIVTLQGIPATGWDVKGLFCYHGPFSQQREALAGAGEGWQGRGSHLLHRACERGDSAKQERQKHGASTAGWGEIPIL